MARPSMPAVPSPADSVQHRPHQPERPGTRVRRLRILCAPHPPPCFPHLLPAVCAFEPAPLPRA
eukprot:scaffold19870_cov45-Isochrysis_galbana.AAC.1